MQKMKRQNQQVGSSHCEVMLTVNDEVATASPVELASTREYRVIDALVRAFHNRKSLR